MVCQVLWRVRKMLKGIRYTCLCSFRSDSFKIIGSISQLPHQGCWPEKKSYTVTKNTLVLLLCRQANLWFHQMPTLFHASTNFSCLDTMPTMVYSEKYFSKIYKQPNTININSYGQTLSWKKSMRPETLQNCLKNVSFIKSCNINKSV